MSRNTPPLERAEACSGAGRAGASGYDPGCACCRLFAHKWTPQIVTVLLPGPHRFSALHKAVPGIGEKTLSRRLVELEEAGIASRVQYLEVPARVEYELTAAGRALEPVIAAMDRWSREFAPALNRDETKKT